MTISRSCFAWVHSVVSVWLACALLTGCTTMHRVPRSDFTQLAAAIKPGDSVKCTLKDGREFAFTVTQVEPKALVGKNHRVELPDLARLEVRRFSTGKTAWLLVGLVATGLMIAGLSNMAVMPNTAPVYP